MTAVVKVLFEPDQEAMRQHVEHLFGGDLGAYRDGKIELAWTDNRPDSAGRYRLKNARLFGVDQIDELVREAAHLNSVNNCNVYIGAALRKPDAAPFGRSQDGDAYALTCAYVDLDDPGAAGAAKDIYGPDKPTFIVLTGRAPHVRAQMWWRLEEPIGNTDWWPGLLRGICGKLNGDSTVTNPSRVMRLAGSIAWPVKPGRTIELTSVAALREPGPDYYSIEHLASIFPPPSEKAATSSATPAPKKELLGMAMQRGEFFRQVNDRALANLDKWVPSIFGADASYQKGTGAWRVSSHALGRSLEEDLSLAPTGIVDFGVHDMGDARNGKRTPIDILLEYGHAPFARDAAFMLCELTGVSPSEMGWSTHPSDGQSTPIPPQETAVSIPIQSAFPVSESGIPVRDWVIPGLLLKRHLSVLVAPPGSGKSLLTLQLAIAVAVGMSWAGWDVRAPKKVLVINAEDDMDEMRRRLYAAAQTMGVSQSGLEGRLFLAQAPESIVIAKTDSKTKTVIRTPLLEDLIRTIDENDIGVCFVDPFAETFEGDENSNSEIKWAGILWREVARRTDAAIELVHHTKKYAGGMAGDADASRGGGSLIGTARIMSTLFAMTEDEASLMNVAPEERTRYVRFDDAKANLNLITGQAKWFEKKTVKLNNGNGLLPGDDVGVLAPWEPPGMLDGVAMFTIGQILDTIDRGLLDEAGSPTGQFYTVTASGPNKDRWAGSVIVRLLGCEEKKAKFLLKEWLKNEVLETYEYADPVARKSRSAVRSVLNNRPDRMPQ